jgi:GDP/UDP-N,N'-diacetylbacillosamine 2-epimerase (hydrolysing)
MVLLLGDRGEMLAGAIAAIHLNIPIAHIHGGERSGTVDEPVRHAISKLAHYHLAATEDAGNRLIAMGERDTSVTVVGAPGLVGLAEAPALDRATLAESAGFCADQPIALLVYHPVLQQEAAAGIEIDRLLDMLAARNIQTMALMPNADAGSDRVRSALQMRENSDWLRIARHLQRDVFVSWMAAADIMIGNSSAGIIEAATFGTPVVNIGSRQNLRQRNANVVDADIDQIDRAVTEAIGRGRFESANVYGDGTADRRIAALLASLDLDADVLAKFNAY